MNKDQGFDMLDNADNKTIERLSEVPVLTEREKERILKMSKEKFGQKYGNNNIEDTVRGVDFTSVRNGIPLQQLLHVWYLPAAS